jgi:hypothetical protein
MTFDFRSAFALSGTELVPEAVAVSPKGNTYVAGTFSGSQNFDPLGSAAGKLQAAAGESDLFLAKYSPAGAFLWVTEISATQTSSDDGVFTAITGLAVDPISGSLYAIGQFEGQLDFTAAGAPVVLSSSFEAGFVAKFTSNGMVDSGLVEQLGGIVGGPPGGSYTLENKVSPTGVAVDSSGQHVVIIGTYSGSGGGEVVEILPGLFPIGGVSSPTYTSASGTLSDTFVLVLSSTLEFVAPPARLGLSDYNISSEVAVDGNGDVFVTGSGNAFSAFAEPFVAGLSLDNFGQLQGPYVLFHTTDPDANIGVVSGVAVDSHGNAYVAGTFQGDVGIATTGLTTATLESAGPSDIFVLKVDSGLNLAWAERIGSSGSDYAIGLAIDGSNNLYLAADLGGSATYNQNGTPVPVPQATNRDAGQSGLAVLRLDTNGTPTGIVLAGGGGELATAQVLGIGSGGLAANASGQVALTGNYTGTLDLSGTTLAAGLSNLNLNSGVTPMAVMSLSDESPAPVAPVFLGESRVIVTIGGRKHHRGKKVTLYQLDFSGPLGTSEVVNNGLYDVAQTIRRGKHRTKTVAIGVRSVFSSPGADSVSLVLGKFTKKKPLTLSATGLLGANGTSIVPIAINL